MDDAYLTAMVCLSTRIRNQREVSPDVKAELYTLMKKFYKEDAMKTKEAVL